MASPMLPNSPAFTTMAVFIHLARTWFFALPKASKRVKFRMVSALKCTVRVLETIFTDPGVENENTKKDLSSLQSGSQLLAGFAVPRCRPEAASVPPTKSADREVDRPETTRAYASVRAAHFHHDAAAFLANNDTSWYVVADSTVALATTTAEKPGVQEC